MLLLNEDERMPTIADVTMRSPSGWSAALSVTVFIPVLDGAAYLPTLFAVLAGQVTDRRVSWLVVDSGSTDGSQDIALAHGARLVQITKPEFGHGRVRNAAVAMADTTLVAFLTQDATPLGPDWLETLTGPFAQPQIAASYGPQVPRATADARTARILSAVYQGPSRTVHDSAQPRPTFSNVNSCLRVADWTAVAFRDVRYAEDFHLERDLLAAGRQVAYVAEAAVLHSNTYTLGQHFGRMLDEVASQPVPTRLRWRSIGKNLTRELVRDVRHARTAAPPIPLPLLLFGLVAEGQRAVAEVSRVRWPTVFNFLYARWSLEVGGRRQPRR